MRSLLMFLWALLAGVPLNAAEQIHSRQQIETDLALQISLQTSQTIQVGEGVDVSLVLRNQSPDTSYAIVKPGDGSAEGWREPYVYFTATIDTGNGVYQPVPESRYASRCANFDWDWEQDARALHPGEELPLKDWLRSPSMVLEFQEAGHVRLVAHYQYRAGIISKGAIQPVVAGLMAGVPAFELVSLPVEFDVVRPLDLVLAVKAPLTVKTETNLSELFDLRLVNRSTQPMDVSSPTISADARLSFEIDGRIGTWPPSMTMQKSTYGVKTTLEPNEEIAVLGDGTFANGADGVLESPVTHPIRVRAIYNVSTLRPAPVIYSNLVVINVVENKGLRAPFADRYAMLATAGASDGIARYLRLVAWAGLILPLVLGFFALTLSIVSPGNRSVALRIAVVGAMISLIPILFTLDTYRMVLVAGSGAGTPASPPVFSDLAWPLLPLLACLIAGGIAVARRRPTVIHA